MTHNTNTPLWVAAVSALLWGLWWMPVRALEASGLVGAWAGTAMLAGALPILTLLFFTGKRRALPDLRAIASGALVGGAMMLYSAALTETTVVRTVLLFYLAPAWAIAIECTTMGRKFRAINALAFVLAAVGVSTVFRGEIAFSNWNFGDILALLAGMAWASGSTLVFTGSDIGARNLGLFGSAGATLIGISLALFAGNTVTAPFAATQATLLALATGTLYIAPVLVATLWSARRLNPTTLAFLLTGEIISGVATSAWFLNEPFGWPETIGSALIISAALVELAAPKSTSDL